MNTPLPTRNRALSIAAGAQALITCLPELSLTFSRSAGVVAGNRVATR